MFKRAAMAAVTVLIAAGVSLALSSPAGSVAGFGDVRSCTGGVFGNPEWRVVRRAVRELYRLIASTLSPEPANDVWHDCYAGLQWTVDNAAELHIDPTRIAVGGESAGGGLAAATCLLARDRGGPEVGFQYLIYPMLDDRNVTPSSREFADGWPGWPRELNVVAWEAVLGGQVGSDEVSPYAAPARATDLANLPPVYIDVGNLEVFRDEDIEFANRLMQAGVPVELHVYPGVFHGWEMATPHAAVTKLATANRRAAMKRALHPAS